MWLYNNKAHFYIIIPNRLVVVMRFIIYFYGKPERDTKTYNLNLEPKPGFQFFCFYYILYLL